MARLAMFASVISLKRVPGLAAMTSGAAHRLLAGNVNAASLISGAATVQAGGTDNPPTTGARPRPAVTRRGFCRAQCRRRRWHRGRVRASGGKRKPASCNVVRMSSAFPCVASSRSSSSSYVKSVNKPTVFSGVSAAWATFGKNRCFPRSPIAPRHGGSRRRRCEPLHCRGGRLGSRRLRARRGRCPGGGLRCRTERSQRRRGRRRARVAIHRRGILCPHLRVEGLGERDRRGVLPEHIGRHQRLQQGAVGRDHRRGHHRRERHLIGRRRRFGLGSCLLGLDGSGSHPRHKGCGCGRHRC